MRAHARAHTHTHTHTRARVCVCFLCICVCVCACVCVCVCVKATDRIHICSDAFPGHRISVNELMSSLRRHWNNRSTGSSGWSACRGGGDTQGQCGTRAATSACSRRRSDACPLSSAGLTCYSLPPPGGARGNNNQVGHPRTRRLLKSQSGAMMQERQTQKASREAIQDRGRNWQSVTEGHIQSKA